MENAPDIVGARDKGRRDCFCWWHLQEPADDRSLRISDLTEI
jgi:hypothetical protein